MLILMLDASGQNGKIESFFGEYYKFDKNNDLEFVLNICKENEFVLKHYKNKRDSLIDSTQNGYLKEQFWIPISGEYKFTGKLLSLNFYSGSREMIIEVIDSLNLRIIKAENKFLKKGDILNRFSRYFPSHLCGTHNMTEHRWLIVEGDEGYEIYFSSEPGIPAQLNYDLKATLSDSLFRR